MKSVIVTGANGFIGQWLVRELAKKKINLYAIVHKIDSVAQELAKLETVKVICCDMNDIESIEAIIKQPYIDVFYHLAWTGSAGKEKSNYNIQLNNTKQACKVAYFAKKINCLRFISVGSIAELLIQDSYNAQILDTNIIYGIQKENTYKLLKVICKELRLEFVWLRLSSVYGPYNTSGNLTCYIFNAIKNKQVPTLTKCEQLYDLVFIKDVINALYLVGISKLSKDCYFVGSGKPKPLKEYLSYIAELLKPNGEIGIGFRNKEDLFYKEDWFEIGDLKKDTGFESKYNFKDSIKETMKWYFN